MKQLIKIENTDVVKFQHWLNLDLENLTWQGRYEKDFSRFWQMLFAEQSTLEEVLNRLEACSKKINAGPLNSWINWLRDKLIFYFFLNKDLSIFELSEYLNISPNKIALLVRGFLLDLFPHLEEYLNSRLQVGNVLSPNLNLKFVEIERDLGLARSKIVGGNDDEVMRSLEVTLYENWKDVLNILEDKRDKQNFAIKKFRDKIVFTKHIKFLQEVCILFFIGWIVVFLINKLNHWYEVKLADKISIYQPEFIRLNKSLIFKEEVPASQVQLHIKEIEELTKGAAPIQAVDVEVREETESEGDFATLDEDLPKNLTDEKDIINAQEELKRQNMAYRDRDAGENKVYRIMINTVDTISTGAILGQLLKNYKIESISKKTKLVDNVPGGIYYNLAVPRENIKKFLINIAQISDADIFESRTKLNVIPGKNKVFVWVKEI